jgi:hypothetical protein
MVPSAAPRAALVQARLHWLRGAAGAAESAWRRALALAREREMPFEEAEALAAMGCCLNPQSELAAQQRAAAAEIHARIGTPVTP